MDNGERREEGEEGVQERKETGKEGGRKERGRRFVK